MSANVIIAGGGCESVAIVGEKCIDVIPRNVTDPTYYILNNSWKEIPQSYSLPSRCEQLKMLLQHFMDIEQMHFSVDHLDGSYSNDYVEYLHWVEKSEDDESADRKKSQKASSVQSESGPKNEERFLCKGSFLRVERGKAKKDSENAFPRNEFSKPFIAAICDSKSKPVECKYQKEKDYLNQSTAIVIRTSLDSLLLEREKKEDPEFIAKHILSNKNLAEKTIALVTIDSLRDYGLNIRKGLSWDQMFTETFRELRSIDRLSQLCCLVVVFHHEGSLVIFPRSENCTLFYSPTNLESAIEAAVGNTPHSSMTLLQAAVIQGVEDLLKDDLWLNESRSDEKNHCLSPQGEEKLCDYIEAGLGMRIRLLVKGYIQDENGRMLKMDSVELAKFLPNQLEKVLKEEKENEKESFDSYRFSRYGGGYGFIVGGFSFFDSCITERNVFSICKEYVQNGKVFSADEQTEKKRKSKPQIPHYEKEGLVTYDRTEIEQFNNLDNLIRGYIMSNNTKPLSLCVFGHPGSGKSFSVRQITSGHKEISKSRLEFNLSQMQDYGELQDAFHRIADEGLGDKVPLAFFDEFDSTDKEGNRLGWLKRFLAPMQDGTYREGGSDFAIGKAIFIFAGGTCKNHAEFMELAEKDPASKGADFISRVKGYVDIKSINPSSGNLAPATFKRALLLRNMIIRKMEVDKEEKIDVEDRVLNAFLKVPKYYHDVRSMDVIIDTSAIARNCKVTASCIGNNCIDIHVPPDFQNYLRGIER